MNLAGDLTNLKFSPGGSYLVAQVGADYKLYDSHSGQMICTVKNTDVGSILSVSFSADEKKLRIVGTTKCEVIACADGTIQLSLSEQFSAEDFKSLPPVVDPSPELWRESTSVRQLRRCLDWPHGSAGIDPSCRLVAIRMGASWDLVNLTSQRRYLLGCTDVGFSPNGESEYFAVFYEAGMELRAVADPDNVIQSYGYFEPEEMTNPRKATLRLIQFGDALCATVATVEQPEQNLYRPIYSEQTHFLDAKSGKSIGSLDFIVEDFALSNVAGDSLTLVRGSRTGNGNKRHIQFAIIRKTSPFGHQKWTTTSLTFT